MCGPCDTGFSRDVGHPRLALLGVPPLQKPSTLPLIFVYDAFERRKIKNVCWVASLLNCRRQYSPGTVAAQTPPVLLAQRFEITNLCTERYCKRFSLL